MIFTYFYFLFLIIFTVKSENNAFNSIMQNILSEYSHRSSIDKNFTPWFFKQVIDFLNCSSLPELNNSRIQYIIKWEEQKIYLEQKCNRYFKANRGNTTEIVCRNGKWTYEVIQCKLTACPIFHKPANSFMTNVAYTYNSVVYFTCFSGYFLRGNSSIRCQETKQWSSPPPVCESTKCLPPLPPKHGNINNTNEVKINETIHFSCTQPYNVKGESVLTCLQDGSWNFPTPVCTLNCVVPEIAGRVVTISEGTILKPRTLINEGEKVLYSCKRSFIPVTYGVVQCLSGEWYPNLQCRKTCKIEKLHGLNFILSQNFSVIEYSCSAGETLLGDSKRTCLENGTWTGNLPSCVKNCQLLPELGLYSYRNGETLQYLPFGSRVPENTNITYSCHLNYWKKSNENVTCANGTLTPKPSCNYKNKVYLNRANNLMFRNRTSMRVCAKNSSCEFFGYRDGHCTWITCDLLDCVRVRLKAKTSEVSFVPYTGTCCALMCHKL
ncbi:sushi, von Willebrand factor type A, EGF and pentraxin domain-containing protein 1 [Octopus bimaculoides]|uniref:Sushi domain-containing protein n=1 Tax=Octopus bimaculoides TaxID=37653 RepID=A0A0L8HDZ6_OCTBM|nr:sushi, von Willebrand factor type A, EGF and pentraxin domain-containing protein 1 [Octopus bimaculoides]|eukprot:XP_014773178.1 PREDICTED: sushi, von Willebrand factor type A, EGF and pentraxin domain-containing protein 1-like [Octopus bimaculoides]